MVTCDTKRKTHKSSPITVALSSLPLHAMIVERDQC